jgi:hypothetical protein
VGWFWFQSRFRPVPLEAVEILSSQPVFRPAGAGRFLVFFPTAYAVGCILAPLRGCWPFYPDTNR